MKKTVSATIIALSFIALQGCTFIRFKDNSDSDKFSFGMDKPSVVASSNFETRSFEPGSFDKVKVMIPTDVRYVPSEEGNCSVSIDAPENYLDHFDLKVEDGTLLIKFDDQGKYRSSKIKCTVYSDALSELFIQGAGDFKADDGIGSAKEFSVTIQGAGDVNVSELDIDSISVLIQGAGDVTASGKATKARVTIQGAGDVDFTSLDIVDYDGSVLGAGKIKRK